MWSWRGDGAVTAMAATAVATSWLRVQVAGEGAACAWCRRWAGQCIPLEMRDEFVRQHRAERPGQPLCAKLLPAEAALEADDPSCLWA